MTSDAVRPMLMVALAITLPLASPAPVRAAPPDRITSLVAGAHQLFALRANAVVTFDAGGREIARCPRFEAPAPTRQPALAVGPIDAQELLRLAGLPDDDFHTPEAEEVLAAEGLAPGRRRRAAPSAPTMAHALAASASADDVWIATSAGLYRGRDGACARVALPGRDVRAVAAVGGAVAAASDELLWRSTDGGRTFRVVAGMVARPRALAIVDDQRTLVATDDAVIEIGLYGAQRTVLDQGGAALAVCGGLALAFTGDGAWTWSSDAAAERVGDRPPARMLACGGGEAARFIAAGDSLYVSADGATWQERRAGAGRSAAAAAIGNRIWLAADDAVVALDDIVTFHPGKGGGTSRLPALPAPATPAASALPPLPTRQLLEPAFPWPQLTLVFTAQRTPLRDGWSLVALIVFRLGRASAARAEGGRLAAELVQRDAALAAHEFELATTPTESIHTGDTARAAQLRAIRQEREALR